MKKAILSVVLILVLMLCACQRQSDIQTARGFRVVVHLECADVYGIGLEYCIDRKLMGVQAVQNAKESRPLGRGEMLSFEFTEMDFSQAELEKGAFGILPEILLKDGESVFTENLWEWALAPARSVRSRMRPGRLWRL